MIVEEPAQVLALALNAASTTGRDGYFRQLNPASARVFGYTRAQLMEQPFIEFVHPDDRGATAAELGRLALGQSALVFEHRFRFGDGTYRWLSWIAVATSEALVYAAARDITDQRTTAGVASQSAPPEQAPSRVLHHDGFLAAVSHDLQQPLTVIKGQAQVLQRQLARGETVNAERLTRSLNYMNSAVERMDDMLHELLDATLPESGQPLSLVLAPTDLIALTRQTVRDHQLAFESHHFALDAEACELMAILDAARMQRVLGNLLSNAIKYSPEGGPIHVRVGRTLGPAGFVAEIAVRDEGLGIPASDVPRIFDRFQRGSNVNRIAGTGLGLAGVRTLVELHGGSVHVETEEGVGSTFSICIPVGNVASP